MRGTANDDEDLWRRLDWNDVRIFLAVAESGSLNAAARGLGMTQPTISRRMEDLESRLGARLFSRHAKGISLTQAGEVVHDLAASMARFGGSIVREVGGHDNNEAGRVRLAAPDGLAGFLIIPALATFQRANPQIHLALDCGLWPESPVEGETDLSLEFTDTCAADVVSIPLATLHYGYYASQEYLDLYGTPRTLTEVAEHRMVHHTSHKEQSRTWHPKFSFVTGLAGMHLVSNSSAATLMAIKHGVGLGILPTFMANLEPELVLLDLDPMAHPVMFLRHHAAAERQGRVKRVKEWLIDLFDPTDQPWYREEYIHPRDFHRSRPGPNPGKAAAALRRR